MSNEIATTQAFQERMFAKIRDQMGDLMTDEDLRKLVESAMQKAFFDNRVVPDGYHTKILPPLFVELIEKQMRETVNKAVVAWLAEHPDEVTKAITDTLGKGMLGMVAAYLEDKTRQPMFELAQRLQQSGVLR